MATKKKSKKELLRQRAEKLPSKKSATVSKIEDRDLKKRNGRGIRIRSAVSDITELKKAQEKAETEHAFRTAIENSILSGIAAVDLEGRQSYVNLGFCRMVGRSEEELVGRKPPFAYWPPEESEHISKAFQTIMSGKSPHEGVQLRFMRKNGERFDARVLSSQLKDSKGKVIGWIGTFGDITHFKQMENDLKQLNTKLAERVRQRTAELENANQQLKQEITERKKAEETLRESKERYRSLATNVPSVLMRYDENLRIVFLSPKAEEATGVPIHRFIGKTNREAGMPAQLCDLWENAIQEVFRTGQTKDLEFDFQSRKGAKTFYHMLAPEFGADGEVRHVLGISTDITERKQMEKALRESEALLRVIVYDSPDPIFLKDRNSRILLANPATIAIVEKSPEEVIGKTDEEFYDDPEIGRAIMANDRRIMESNRTEVIEETTIGPTGKRTYLSTKTPYRDADGQVIGIIGVARDITERKQLEEELRRSRDDLEVRVQERTAELMQAVEELQDEISERKRTEETLRKLTHELSERIKEVNCLYSVCYYVEKPYGKLTEKLQNIVNLLPSGWQYPEITCARITLEGKEYKTDHFKETPWKQAGDIIVHEETVGTVEIYYLEEKPDCEEGPFSKEERQLINAIAVELSEMIAHKRADEAVKAERQRFNDVLEMLPAYVVLLTPDYHVPFANRFFRERFGESLGRRCFEYLFGRSEPCEICESYTAAKTNAPHHWEWVGPDGRIYDIYDFPFADTDGSPLILEMGIDITDRKRAEEALRQSETQLRFLSSQLLTVQENERRSIARELHDGVGQLLAAVKFEIESALQLKSKKKSLEAVVPLLRESIEEVRRVQMDLRPSTLDDLGVLATLEWFCREYQNIYSHIRIEKKIGLKESDVPMPVKTVIYRVTQEALNNIAKHSKANLVRFSLNKEENEIELIIRDDGIGFDLEQVIHQEGSKRGLGLTSMRERIQLSGGSCVIESTPGQGTTLRATWPI